MPQRTRAAASTASSSHRCTARHPSARCLKTTCARRSTRGELCGRLSTDRPRRGRRSLRIRGIGPLESPDSRRDLARQVHSAGRGMRPHRARSANGCSERRSRKPLTGPTTSASQSTFRRSSSTIRASSTSCRMLSTETGVRADRLELEITEGVFLAEGDTTDETFAKLKTLGVRLALDDFGTGYSSLGYLKKAPFDKIKIDQSFVRGAASTTNRNAAIIRAIVTLAESLRMDTCAEGRRNPRRSQPDPRARVSAMVQGYIFGKPMPTRRRRANWPTQVRVEADGYQCIREPRHRLMRRAIASHRRRGERGAPAQHLARWARWSNATFRSRRAPSSPWTSSASGPCAGSSAGLRPASSESSSPARSISPDWRPRSEKHNDVTMLRPWYVDKREAS